MRDNIGAAMALVATGKILHGPSRDEDLAAQLGIKGTQFFDGATG